MKLKPCPFCGSVPILSTDIGFDAWLGCVARAWIWCPKCEKVSHRVRFNEKDIVNHLPDIKAPMRKRDKPFAMHPTVQAAIRPVVVAAVKKIWDRRC